MAPPREKGNVVSAHSTRGPPCSLLLTGHRAPLVCFWGSGPFLGFKAIVHLVTTYFLPQESSCSEIRYIWGSNARVEGAPPPHLFGDTDKWRHLATDFVCLFVFPISSSCLPPRSFSLDRVSLCSIDCTGTCAIDQAGLKLIEFWSWD